MKKEFREVIIKQEVYIADDGREFMDEEDCEEYELKLLEKTLKCYNEDYDKSDVESCTFIDLITEKDVEVFKKVCYYHGIIDDGIDKPGLYMFDDTYRNSTWINLDDVIFHIRGGIKND